MPITQVILVDGKTNLVVGARIYPMQREPTPMVQQPRHQIQLKDPKLIDSTLRFRNVNGGSTDRGLNSSAYEGSRLSMSQLETPYSNTAPYSSAKPMLAIEVICFVMIVI